MAKNPSYKQSTTTTIKASRFLDSDNSAIEIDGNSIQLSQLFSKFDGEYVEFQIKKKEDADLEFEETIS